MSRGIEVIGIYRRATPFDDTGADTFAVKFIKDGEVLGWRIYAAKDELEAYTRAMDGTWNKGHEKELRQDISGNVGWLWVDRHDKEFQLEGEPNP